MNDLWGIVLGAGACAGWWLFVVALHRGYCARAARYGYVPRKWRGK